MRLWDFPLPGSEPRLLSARSSTNFILVVVCVGIFVDVFVYGVVVPILPFTLEERVGITGADAQRWVLTLLATFGAAFMVTSILCALICGRLQARRIPLFFGVIALLGGTTVIFFTTSLPVMVMGRLLQGAGSADTWILGQALVTETVGKDSVGRVVGYLVSSFSLSSFVAPLLGGVVYQGAGYMTVYGMLAGLICTNIALILFLIEPHEVGRWSDRAIDDRTRTSPFRAESFSGTLRGVNSASEPTLQEVFQKLRATGKIPAFLEHMLSALLGVGVAFAGLTAFETTVPQFVSETFHWNSRAAGLIFVAQGVPLVVGGPLIGPLVDKYGARWIATAGLASSIPWWVLLGQISHDSFTQKAKLCACLALLGLSAMLTTTALMTAVAKVDQQAYLLSFAFSTFAVGIGVTIGSVWSGMVQVHGSWATMTWSFAIAHGIAAIVVMLFVDGRLDTRWFANGHTNKANLDLIPSTPTSPTPLLA